MRSRRPGQHSSLHGTWSFLRQVVNGMTPRSRRIYIFMGVVIISTLVLQLVHSSLSLVFRVNINRDPVSLYGNTYTIRYGLPISSASLASQVALTLRVLLAIVPRRVNTFRRNDMLKAFVEHFTTCPNVHAIQIVWSDQDNAPPPLSFFKISPHSRVPVLFEKQPTDSLNNRFRAILPVETPAVLSVDDDLVISCKDLDFAHKVWQASPQSLVGFTPRLATWDKEQRGYHYQSSWKVVWWHGLYNIVLTKCCFMHRDFLGAYFSSLSREMLSYVDEHRNCEDLAMQFVVSNATGGVPPVWVQARFQDRGTHSGISQGKDHERERSQCVTRLVKEFGRLPLTVTSHKAIDARAAWWF